MIGHLLRDDTNVRPLVLRLALVTEEARHDLEQRLAWLGEVEEGGAVGNLSVRPRSGPRSG